MSATKEPGDAGTSAPAMDINQIETITVPDEKSIQFSSRIADTLAFLLQECGEDVIDVRNIYSKHGELSSIQVFFADGSTRQVSTRRFLRPAAACRDVINTVIDGGDAT